MKLHDFNKTWIITLCNITQFTSVEKCFRLHKFTVNPHCALRFWPYRCFEGLEEQELREHAADSQHVQGSLIWGLRSEENRQGDCCLPCPLSHRLFTTPWQNYLGHLVCGRFRTERNSPLRMFLTELTPPQQNCDTEVEALASVPLENIAKRPKTLSFHQEDCHPQVWDIRVGGNYGRKI